MIDSGEFKSVMVCGDFNLPKVKWPETDCWVNNGCQEEDEFLNGCDECLMTQVLSRLIFGENCKGGNIMDFLTILKSDPERIFESKIDWECILNELNIDEANDRFLSIYYKLWNETYQ